MWKFDNFSVTKIFREINFDDWKTSKSMILTNSDVLKLEFWKITASKGCENCPNWKLRGSKIVKLATFYEMIKSPIWFHIKTEWLKNFQFSTQLIFRKVNKVWKYKSVSGTHILREINLYTTQFLANSKMQFICETLDFTEFLLKSARVKFCNFHTVSKGLFKRMAWPWITFWKIRSGVCNLANSDSVVFTEFYSHHI